MVAVLVLDFDGTVLDTEWPAYRAAAELWEAHGEELTFELWCRRIGTNTALNPFAELEQRLGRRLDPDLQRQRIARKNALTDEAPLNAGVLAWLDDAEQRGIRVGIASSSPSSWVERNLVRLGLRDRFHCLACCGDGIPAKPDPASYLHAVDALGGDPSESVAVEDSEHGVVAARGAGLFTVAVPHDLTRHMDLSGADVVVASLDDLTLEDAMARAAARAY